jgi:RNA polymerase sigma factor (sigma-70 family)
MNHDGAGQGDATGIVHLDGLYSYAMVLSRNHVEAEDLVQEPYVRAIQALGRLRTDSNMKSWLFTILRNLRLNQLRSSSGTFLSLPGTAYTMSMPRPKTGDKRAAILRAATKTIAEDGIGASTASVAKAAAVAEGSLFRYFQDKDKLLNELYRELKLDMRRAMIAGFPLTGSLRKRVQHIWNAYVTWGMESPAKRRAMMQLSVSERITDQSRQDGQAGFEDATEAMQQFVARGKLSGLPPAFASDLLLAMAETTMASMVANPAKAEHYRSAGFEAFWSAAAKK